MPSFPHTPEALLGRNDSKNPSTTCKGITSSGRPCRRALAISKPASIRKRNASIGGVVAIVREDGDVQEADFYCWQHKDQAEQRVQEEHNNPARPRRRSTELFPLKEKSSIDTLVQRLGLETLPEEENRKSRAPKTPRRTDARDFAQQGAEPLRREVGYAEKDEARPGPRKPKTKRSGFWASLCCVAVDPEDYVEIVRHRKRTEQSRPSQRASSPTARIPSSRPKQSTRQSDEHDQHRTPASSPPVRPPPDHCTPAQSQTSRLLTLIPPHLSPGTTSALLAELTKPISPHDEEGYIYIFWLTPQSKPTPAEETARSLLTPSRPANDRRVSDVMTEYSYDGSEPNVEGKKTIMLKIGRANNVTRRLNEWTKQCGYALNLVRWYPYLSSSAAPSPRRPSAGQALYPDLSLPAVAQRRQSDKVRKVPCVKRVERLVHLELHEQQVKRQCTSCGKEHREWFEVEASQAGVRRVDECVRRWVGWAEGLD